MYYVVLAKISNEDEKEIIAIYLYRNQKHKPSNFFQLNEYEKWRLENFMKRIFSFFSNRISDHCSKPIKSSYYLFELVGKDPSDIEIFGANNVNDLEVGRWMFIEYWLKLNFD